MMMTRDIGVISSQHEDKLVGFSRNLDNKDITTMKVMNKTTIKALIREEDHPTSIMHLSQ